MSMRQNAGRKASRRLRSPSCDRQIRLSLMRRMSSIGFAGHIIRASFMQASRWGACCCSGVSACRATIRWIGPHIGGGAETRSARCRGAVQAIPPLLPCLWRTRSSPSCRCCPARQDARHAGALESRLLASCMIPDMNVGRNLESRRWDGMPGLFPFGARDTRFMPTAQYRTRCWHSTAESANLPISTRKPRVITGS